MIDNEQLIYDTVTAALRKSFEGIFIIGTEITDVPPQFPAVSIVQLVSEVNGRYSTFEYVQNGASEEYKFEAYSNLEDEKSAKEQTKSIIAVIDGVMSDLFYLRSFCQPIPTADGKTTRHVARYKNNNVTMEE